MSQTHEVTPAGEPDTGPEPGHSAQESAPIPEPVPGRGSAPSPTGNDRVDAVVRSLDALEDRPAEEHVPVFEAAHRELRDALTASGDPA